MKRDVFIVHRLDKVAGGLLVVATSRKFAREIGEMIKRSRLKKSYLVSVQGRIQMLLNPDYFLKIEYVSDLFFSFEQNGGFKGNGGGQKKKKQNTEGRFSVRFYFGFVKLRIYYMRGRIYREMTHEIQHCGYSLSTYKRL